MSQKATKRASVQHISPRKDPKEIVLAKLSVKQAIIVAIIGLVSAVTITVIANLDKLAGGRDSTNQEIGYYEGRAFAVDHALKEVEEGLQARSKAAREQGNSDEATRLSELAVEVQRRDVEFREGHRLHIEEIKSGKRLDASKRRLKLNQELSNMNITLHNGILVEFEAADIAVPSSSSICLSADGPSQLDKKLTKEELRACQEWRRAYRQHEIGHSIPLIPLYGMGDSGHKEQLCRLPEDGSNLPAEEEITPIDLLN